ncbi:hypothetical protein IF650_17765 [Cellulosimicrobium terreum]|nr:hypothetical protein [Cellulosimicrobium terreum]
MPPVTRHPARELRPGRSRSAVPQPDHAARERALEAHGWTRAVRSGPVGQDVVVNGDGRRCDVTYVPVPADAAERDGLVEHLRGLAEEDEHLVTVRAVLESAEGELAVLTDHHPGLRLDELAAARGPFAAGEAVTVLVPVAQGLVTLHRSGRAHGALDARAVVVEPDGRAVLRVPLVPVPGTGPDDVRRLARLVVDLVPSAASAHPDAVGVDDPGESADLAALHAELVAALRDDPAARPAVGTFAARCFDAVEVRPVQMPDPARLVANALAPARARREETAETPSRTRASRRADRPVPSRPSTGARAGGTSTTRTGGPLARSGLGRGLVVLGGVVLGCLALVAVMTATGGDEPDAGPGRGAVPSQASTTDPVLVSDDPVLDPQDPVGAGRELTRRRLDLLTGGSGALDQVVVPGSPAEASDSALLAELADVDVVDATATVHDARPVGGTEGPAVQVEVDYAVSAHRQRTGDEEIEVPRTERTTVVLTVRWTDDGWRVSDVG